MQITLAAILQLTKNKITILDLEDYKVHSKNKWCYCPNGSAVRRYKNKILYLHREITKCPTGMEVDHINGDRLDNRKINLRIVTHADNIKNQKIKSTNSTGYKGVSFYKREKRYVARITNNKKTRILGYFRKAEDAYEAYCKGSRKHHKEYGKIN